jgi:hypothetical protein
MDATGNLRLLTEDTEVEWESYGNSYYISCPHCAARNVALRVYDSETSLELHIVAAVTEGE